MNHRKNKCQKGQSLVEYLILVALVGVGSLVVVSTMGQNLNSRFAYVITSMGGKTEEKVETVSLAKDAYQRKNLGNFMTESTFADENKNGKRQGR